MTAAATPDYRVAIVGAGPLGLAAAAHLRAGRVQPFICGHPMEFWRDQMPPGMLLRSPLRASSIASPNRELSLERWTSVEQREMLDPLPLADFIAYGEWYQGQVAPDLDRRKVASIKRANGAFRLQLTDGAEVRAARVVVAAGIGLFAFVPRELRDLPPELLSHTSEHTDFARFAGRSVAVLGSGQSALESAALLHEAGADVELIFRSNGILWLDALPAWRLPKMQAPTAVGGPRSSWLVAAPDVFRRLPDTWQPRIAYRCIRPAGASWLHKRMDGIRMTIGGTILAAAPCDDGLLLTLNDAERRVDHLVVGTGYEIDIRRYPFFAPELTDLLEMVEVVDGYPILGRGLESSITGLHFIGAPAARTFGPVMRFVTGSWYAAPTLARHILGRRQLPVSWAF